MADECGNKSGCSIDENLSNVIAENLSAYTDLGLDLASQSVDLLTDTIREATNALERNIRKYKRRDYQDKGVMRSLSHQLETIKGQYEHLPARLEEDVLTLPDGTFTITLFGRTEAGKSTLMNVLTHGDGSQIGEGAQRTTRNVRTYSYRGLDVVDVPGIAAAGTGGMEDEEKAFERARRSDLIIFLIMGDAQESEARCLARIKELGKPVMLLLNVQVGIDDRDGFDLIDLEDFEYEMQDEFDRHQLEETRQSLVAYGPKYGQNWNFIPCAYVHLKSAFMSQREEFAKYSEKLYHLSHFDDAVHLIEKEVCRCGGYYRLKSYSDAVASPLIEMLESLFEQSAENSRQGRLLIHTRRTLEHWMNRYIERSEARIDDFVTEIEDELRREANSFVEDNYNNRDAVQAWNKRLASLKIEARGTEIISDLERECDAKLTNLRREVDFDTKVGKYVERRTRFKAYVVIDAKRTWGWGTKILAGALTIVGVFFIEELLVVGIAVGAIGELGNRIFGFERIRNDARSKMRAQLYDSIDEQARWLKKEMHRLFDERIIGDLLVYTCREINTVINALFNLSNVQRQLAMQINRQLRALNKVTITEALAYLGNLGCEKDFIEIARLPGVATTIVLKDGARLPPSLKNDLRGLLGEVIWYVFFTDNAKVMLSRVIGRGCDRSRISIERIDGDPRIAHIRGLGNLKGDALTRVRLGMQVTELVIME